MSELGITPELIAFVKSHEGWVAKPYICPAGYPTQGWGRRIPSMDRPPITREVGEQWLRADLKTARDATFALSPSLLTASERRIGALIDFTFNLGAGRYRSSTLRKRVDEQAWPEAAVELRRWVFAAGRKFAPLVRRRETMAGWLEEG